MSPRVNGSVMMLALLWFATSGVSAVIDQLPHRVMGVPSVADFERRHGNQRNLSRSDVRNLYLRILDHGKLWAITAVSSGVPRRSVAIACGIMRWRARLYCRQRDAEGGVIGQALLILRDAYVHGVPNLLTGGGTINAWACFAQHEDYPCPSYDILSSRKTDEQIVESCWKSNPAYNGV
jgi:hypothetical protein